MITTHVIQCVEQQPMQFVLYYNETKIRADHQKCLEKKHGQKYRLRPSSISAANRYALILFSIFLLLYEITCASTEDLKAFDMVKKTVVFSRNLAKWVSRTELHIIDKF